MNDGATSETVDDLTDDLCNRLALLGASREACRVLNERDPYVRWQRAWELGRHPNADVRRVGAALEALVERGSAAAPMALAALRDA